MFNNILIVCIGNVCRSPTVERLMQAQLPAKNIESAGLGALVGNPANSQAIKIAKGHHLSLNNHKARQLTNEICKAYDLILGMEKAHIEGILQLSPESRGKVMLLGHWLDNVEIEDPYRRSDEMYEHVFELLKKATTSWIDKL